MHRLLCAAALIAAVCPVQAHAAIQARPAAAATRAFDIPAGPMEAALVAFGRQSGLQILYAAEAPRGLRSAGVRGRLSSAEALDRLLEGSGLTHRLTATGAVVIARGQEALTPTRLC